MTLEAGQAQDRYQRQEGKEHGHDHRAAIGGTGDGDAQRQGQHRAQGCTAAHAQRGAIRQGIAQQALHRRAAQGQRSTHQCHIQHAGQAYIQDDALGNACGDLHAPKAVPQGGDGVLQRDIHAAHADAQQHGGDQRSHKQDIRLPGKVFRKILHCVSRRGSRSNRLPGWLMCFFTQ